MSERWEYMTFSWIYRKKWTSPQLGGSGDVWSSEFQISRYGEQVETRPASNSEKRPEKPTGFMDLLHEFGADGWELVGETVLDTVLVGEEHGWRSKGTPAHVRWTLKRRLDS
jgi:hypothetical protein